MPFTPDPPFPKTQGDNVRSKDWNDALAEVIRLDSAKTNRAGDRFTGPLTIDGNVGIGTTTPKEPLDVNGRVKAGTLTIGPWPAPPIGNAAYSFLGANTLDQTNPANYALMQGAAGGEVGVTFLNSPANIRLRIANTDKMVVAANGNISMLGALNVVGPLGAGNVFNGSPFRLGIGKTPPGATAWQVYSTNGIFVVVDTTAAGFTKTPTYLTALGGISNHWAVVGHSSIYVPSATGFTIYMRWATDAALTPASANSMGWYIQWLGIEI
jgi:hypothetical protein